MAYNTLKREIHHVTDFQKRNFPPLNSSFHFTVYTFKDAFKKIHLNNNDTVFSSFTTLFSYMDFASANTTEI